MLCITVKASLSVPYDDRLAVEPTMSVEVKRKVTVPVGRSGILRLLQCVRDRLLQRQCSARRTLMVTIPSVGKRRLYAARHGSVRLRAAP